MENNVTNQNVNGATEDDFKRAEEARKVNLLIAGKTGVGKTTLMNAIFGREVGKTAVGPPVTQGISVVPYEVPGIPIRMYDVQGFELALENTKRVMGGILEKIHQLQQTGDIDKMLDAVVYCFSMSLRKIEDMEIGFLQKVANANVPVLIVFTRANEPEFSSSEEDDFEQVVRNKLHDVRIAGYYRVMSKKDGRNEAFGVDALMDDICNKLPEQKRRVWIEGMQALRANAYNRAVIWIWGYAAANFAIGGLTPPIVDIAALSTSEMFMAGQIANIMFEGQPVDTNDIAVAVKAAVMGPMAGTLAGYTLFKGVTWLAGVLGIVFTGGASAVAAVALGGGIAAAVTVALGLVTLSLMDDLVNGKIKLEDLKTEQQRKRIKEDFDKNLEEAKERINADPNFSKIE